MSAVRAPQAWQLQRLLSAPHRLGFACGAALMAVLSLWWLAGLAASRAGLALPWAVAPTLAHGLLFTLGFMPAFIVGFLFTAGPRWLGVPGVEAGPLLTPLLQLGGGWLLVMTGSHASAWLAAVGAALAAAAWLRLTLRFAALVRASRAEDRLHAKAVLLACVVGVLAMALASAALLWGDAALLHAAIQLGLWGFVAPVYAVVSHRMVPFFSAAALPQLDAWRPHALLLPLVGGLWLGGCAELGLLPAVLLAPLLALAALALLTVALRWGLLRSLRGESLRLLAMLHGGFLWLGVALLLQAVSQALQALGRPGLGLAPLHALTLGYLGCTLIAMITRVAAGHSGRPLTVDRGTWAIYGLLQLGVLARLGAALGLDSLLPAAVAWAVVTGFWAWRYGGWLGRPRVDGRPG
ncbi:NnrS family protein [Roseateles sp. LKC17W]|uniref:NnrS family protein n=1 Tax=Pelomonas margarita TaxID=3299031 RepID=A0ABW7FBW2_9BURK